MEVKTETKAYYLTRDNGQRVLIYVSLSIKDANKLFAPLVREETGEEIHVTTDHQFDMYIDKRRVTPRFVKIFQNKKELQCALDEAGLLL